MLSRQEEVSRKEKSAFDSVQCFIAVPEEENQGKVISENNSIKWFGREERPQELA